MKIETKGPDVSSIPSTKAWVRFLRSYGPIPTNDNMYDETIQRALKRLKIRPISRPAPLCDSLVGSFRSATPVSHIVTGTAGDGKTYRCREVWNALGGSSEAWDRGDKIQTLDLGDKTIVIVRDLSELRDQESSSLIVQFAKDTADPAATTFYIFAANHGQLLEKLKSAPETPEVRRVSTVIEDLLVTGISRDEGIKLKLDDLSRTPTADMARANLPVHSQDLRGVAAKIRNLIEGGALNHIEPDLEALTEAEGLAHRAGPRPHISPSTFDGLRTAIKSCRKVSFDYASRSGRSSTRRTVAPLGFLYGHRHYLVALQEGATKPKFFSLPSISKLKLETDGFERDPGFSLKEFVSHSFGVFEEAPLDVVWQCSAEAAPLARTFVFHHSQSVEDEADGKLIVRFRASGLLEMGCHLMSWGDQVEVIEPAALRDFLPEKAQSWPALP